MMLNRIFQSGGRLNKKGQKTFRGTGVGRASGGGGGVFSGTTCMQIICKGFKPCLANVLAVIME